MMKHRRQHSYFKNTLLFLLISIVLLSLSSCLIIMAEEGDNLMSLFDTRRDNVLFNYLRRIGILEEGPFILGKVEYLLKLEAENNTGGMKSLFAANVINEISDATLTKQLTEFCRYIKGDLVNIITKANGESKRFEYGKISYVNRQSFWITTTNDEYLMGIKYVTLDDFDSGNIGIWSISIIEKAKDTDPEVVYQGDGKYNTGIYFDIPRWYQKSTTP